MVMKGMNHMLPHPFLGSEGNITTTHDVKDIGASFVLSYGQTTSR